MPRTPRLPLALGALCLLATACAAPAVDTATPSDRSWEEVLAAAEGQTVDLWMWGGDERGNAYVDDVLAPAAAELGVTLRRVPVTDTKDALRRVLAERAAGEDVEMQMHDFLVRVAAHIGQHPVAALGQTEFAGGVADGAHQAGLLLGAGVG